MKDNLLSIVIPCKNEEKQIGRTLELLLNQTIDISKVPIYIADAGSTDSTLHIIGKFISEGRLNIKIVPGGYTRATEAKHSKNQDLVHMV